MIGAVMPPVNRDASSCRSIARLLGAHADGQLDAAKTLEVDDHLGKCEDCRERVALDRAIRGSVKKAVSTTTPDDVRARMLVAMAGERARESKQRAEAVATAAMAVAALRSGVEDGPAGRPVMLRHWRTMLPLSAAAVIAFAWGFAGKQPMAQVSATTSS